MDGGVSFVEGLCVGVFVGTRGARSPFACSICKHYFPVPENTILLLFNVVAEGNVTVCPLLTCKPPNKIRNIRNCCSIQCIGRIQGVSHITIMNYIRRIHSCIF